MLIAVLFHIPSILKLNAARLPGNFAIISLARCSPIPGSDLRNTRFPSSMAVAISGIARLSARTAALGPTPDTVMNFSKNSFSMRLEKPIKIGIVLFSLTEAGAQQFSFFDDQKKNKLNQVMDLINDRHGANTLLSASYLDVVDQAKARISFQHIPDLKKNDF